jgi:hypothetical protein
MPGFQSDGSSFALQFFWFPSSQSLHSLLWLPVPPDLLLSQTLRLFSGKNPFATSICVNILFKSSKICLMGRNQLEKQFLFVSMAQSL